MPYVSVSGTYGTLTYEWFINGAPQWGGSSLTVNATNGNQIYVKVHSSGCANSPFTTLPYTINVTSSTSPSGSINKNKPLYCSGETIQLTAQSAQLTGSSTYEWRLNGNLLTPTTQSISIPSSYTQANGYFYPGSIVTVKMGGLSGTCLYPTTYDVSISSDIVIQRPPGVSAIDPPPLCSGSAPNVVLSEQNSMPNTTYSWTVSASNVTGASASSGSVINQTLYSANGISNGTVTYSITPVTNGCAGPVKNVVATVIAKPPPPAVAGTARFGEGALTLLATSPHGAAFRWYRPSNTLVAQSNPFITPLVANSTANYCYATVVNASNCESDLQPVSVNIYPIPVIAATNSNVFMGSSAVLNPGGTYDAYEWRNELEAVVATTRTYSTNQPGVYRVVVWKGGITTTSQPFRLYGQFGGQNANYVVTNTFLQEGVKTVNLDETLTVDQRSQTVQYFDGLGRPLQVVSTQASPQKKDIVQTTVYDAFGRAFRDYLPFAGGTDGWNKPTHQIIDPQSGQYIGMAQPFYATAADKVADDTHPFAEKVFEPSPLQRLAEQGAPGAAWQPSQGKTVQKEYQVNAAQEVLHFGFDPGQQIILLQQNEPGRTYLANTLFKEVTFDEHGRETMVFKNKTGNVVCKKSRLSPTEFAETYYVYDDFQNLVVVLPPEAVKTLRAF
jgi:hypothetical protein